MAAPDALPPKRRICSMGAVEADGLITREELTAYLFNAADIRDDVGAIRRILEEEHGEGPEEDA